MIMNKNIMRTTSARRGLHKINLNKMNQQLLIGEIVQETKESSANHDQLSTSTNLPAKIEEHSSNNFLELVIRLKFDEKPDKRKLTQIKLIAAFLFT